MKLRHIRRLRKIIFALESKKCFLSAMKRVAQKALDGSPGEHLQIDTIDMRWGKGSSAGFAAVPNALIHAQAELGLSANDMVVILNLLSHWWYRQRTPFPSSALIAKRSGLGIRNVQRSLKRLREAQLIEAVLRPEGGTRYEFSGLLNATEEKALAHSWRSGNFEERTPKPATHFNETEVPRWLID